MTEIRLQDARTGMVLQSDVTDASGHVLLKAGVVLSRQHLNLLNAHSVTDIRIGAENADTDPDAETRRADPQQLFRNLDPDHPLTQALKRWHRQRLMPGTAEVGDDG